MANICALLYIIIEKNESRVLLYEAASRSKVCFNLNVAIGCIVYLLHSITKLRIVYTFSVFFRLCRESKKSRTSHKQNSPEASVDHSQNQETQMTVSQ